MNTKIIKVLADYVNAYENFNRKFKNEKEMLKLTKIYNKILFLAEKYPDDYQKFMKNCISQKLDSRFKSFTEILKKRLM